MADKGNDPVAMWQNMIGEMEKGFNAFANQAMASPEFRGAINQVGGATAEAQRQFGEMMEKYLASMSLPNREQMAGMAARLQVIEAQLDEIKALLQAHIGRSEAGAAAAKSPPAKRAPRKSGSEA